MKEKAETPRRGAAPFERFVQRIAAVPKATIDALEAAERDKGAKTAPKIKRAR